MAKGRVGKGFVSVYNFQVTLCPGGHQGRNLKASREGDAMEGCYWLSRPVSYRTQDHLHHSQ